MKIDLPGLVRELERSGATRWRVRVEGNPRRRITLPVAPGDRHFLEHYHAARAGQKLEHVKDASERLHRGSMAWLLTAYLAWFERQVEAGLSSAKTLKKKRNLLGRLSAFGDRKIEMPREKLLEMKDAMAATPAQADAFVEAVGVMYAWAVKRGYARANPADGIERSYKKGAGAQPWTVDDLRRYFAHHKTGTKANVALSVLLWTGCRVEDLTMLGRSHECLIDGIEALRWQPKKKGSSEVSIPLLPPLKEAVRAPTVQGATYVLGRGGRPFASGDSMSAMVKRWCREAGLPHLSAHGVRKALAELLAGLGCSQYEIMAILGHSEAKTSEIYTRRVERFKLAMNAMERVDVSLTLLARDT